MYFSFGFKDSPKFYYEKNELDSKAWILLSDYTSLKISSITTKGGNKFIKGRFSIAYIAFDKKGQCKKGIEISNGQFILIIESSNTIIPTIVEKPMDAISILLPTEVEFNFNLPTILEFQPTVRIFIFDQHRSQLPTTIFSSLQQEYYPNIIYNQPAPTL